MQKDKEQVRQLSGINVEHQAERWSAVETAWRWSTQHLWNIFQTYEFTFYLKILLNISEYKYVPIIKTVSSLNPKWLFHGHHHVLLVFCLFDRCRGSFHAMTVRLSQFLLRIFNLRMRTETADFVSNFINFDQYS